MSRTITHGSNDKMVLTVMDSKPDPYNNTFIFTLARSDDNNYFVGYERGDRLWSPNMYGYLSDAVSYFRKETTR